MENGNFTTNLQIHFDGQDFPHQTPIGAGVAAPTSLISKVTDVAQAVIGKITDVAEASVGKVTDATN
jgi:hypothetical protein